MTTYATPPTITPTDRARTRRTDPETSHAAGDLSQTRINTTKVHVMQVLLANPDKTGSEINDLYLFTGARLGWDRVAPDSPRKRTGELVDEGYVQVTGTRPAYGKGQSARESIYRLTDYGRRIVTLGHER